MKNQIIYLCGDWKWKMKNNNQNMFPQKLNLTGGEMNSVVVSSAVDGTFNPRSCQTKDFKNFKIKICIWCFFHKHAEPKEKEKRLTWLAL